MTTILHITSSARAKESASRKISQRLVNRFPEEATVIERDLAKGVPQLTGAHIEAVYTPEADRTPQQTELLQAGSEYIAELRAADVVVIAAPIYNFGPPAELKAWADHVSRSGDTFSFDGTEFTGLVNDRPTYFVYASGMVPQGSPGDFVTPWLTAFLDFLGITSVKLVPVEGADYNESVMPAAEARVDNLAL